jgi:hypothetical protein
MREIVCISRFVGASILSAAACGLACSQSTDAVTPTPGTDAGDDSSNDSGGPAPRTDASQGTDAASPPTENDASAGADVTPPPITGPAFYVALDGNDSWSGKLPAPNAGKTDGPFATLPRAQHAMQASSIKRTAIRGGTYSLGATLELTSADSGETWQYYPSDGYDSAVLDGGGKNAVTVNGGSNITFDGLQIQNVDMWGIGVHGGVAEGSDVPDMAMATSLAQGDAVRNCIIHGVHNDKQSPDNFNAAGIMFGQGTPDALIENNVVYDSNTMGIRLGAPDPAQTHGSDNGWIRNNVVYGIGQHLADTGAIYLIDYSFTSVNVRVTNNYVRDWGLGGRGIYLDNNSTNVTVTGNVVAPPGPQGQYDHGWEGTTAIFFNSATNSTVSGNIIDLGSVGQLITAVHSHYPGLNDPTGDAFRGNIVISNFAGKQQTSIFGVTGDDAYISNTSTRLQIQNDVYRNYGGGEESSNGNTSSDSNPIHEDPGISGWAYAIAAGSPVFKAPVSFAPIAANWGPPGYVLAHGTAPSCPH